MFFFEKAFGRLGIVELSRRVIEVGRTVEIEISNRPTGIDSIISMPPRQVRKTKKTQALMSDQTPATPPPSQEPTGPNVDDVPPLRPILCPPKHKEKMTAPPIYSTEELTKACIEQRSDRPFKIIFGKVPSRKGLLLEWGVIARKSQCCEYCHTTRPADADKGEDSCADTSDEDSSY